MENLNVTHSTFVIERHYPASSDRVFQAFSDPAKKRRWMGEGAGRDMLSYEMDFQVGGREHRQSKMGDNTPFPGVILTNQTTYLDIIPLQRIVFAYTMALGDHPMSAGLATVEFRAGDSGTDVIFTEQGAYFEGSDGPERREHGWRKLLENIENALE